MPPIPRLFAIFFLLPFALQAQPIRVSGRVVDPENIQGASSVRIELLPASEDYAAAVRRLHGEPESKPLATARSDAEGFFEIATPEAGAYRLRVRAAGFLSEEHLLVPLVEDTDLETISLIPAEPFEIRVTSGEGRPLPGIAVRLLPERAGPSWQRDLSWYVLERGGVTGAGGRLTISRRHGEPLTLVAVSPGFLGQSASLGEHPQPVSLRPSPASRLEARGGDGTPVPGALVRWRSWPVGVTGPDGRLDLAFPPGDEPLRVESRDGGSAQVATAPISRATLVTVRLEPPRTLAGQVLQKESPKPVPNALVWTGSRLLSPPAHTGEDGRFQLAIPAAEDVTLEAAAPGYLRAESRFVPWTSSTGPSVLRLEPAARISGQVVDEKGRPVSQASLRVNSQRGQRMTLSRADGRFLLSGLRFQGSYEIQAFRQGFTHTSLKTRTPAPGQTAPPVRIVLGSGQTAVGRVVDEAGNPVSGARVAFTSRAKARFPVTTDAEGRFEIRALEAGRFMLRVRGTGFSPVRRAVEIPAQPRKTDLGDVELPAGTSVEGEVKDTKGLPIAGASVWSDLSSFGDLDWVAETEEPRPDVQTGMDGRFRLTDLPRGTPIHLRIEHEGYVSLSVPGVEAPTREPLHLEMKAARSLSGRVVGPAGELVADATLTCIEELRTGNSTSGSSRSLGSTDARGSFRVTSLEPGPNDLQVSAKDYATRTVRGVLIPQDRDLEGFEIVLDRGAILQVRVLTSEGAPVADASLQAEPKEQRVQRQQPFGWNRPGMFGNRTDDRGNGQIELPEPGVYRVTASTRDRSVSGLVQAAPGTTPVELRFPSGVEISGRVMDAKGEGIAGANLTLRVEQGPASRQNAWSDADGTFAFRQVPEGTYRLNAQREGFVQAGEPREVVVAGSDVLDLGVRLEPVTGATTLKGRLLGLAPEDLLRASVQAFGRQFPEKVAVDSDGRYEIRNLSPGDWYVTAFTTGGRRHLQQSIQIQPGDSEAVLDFDFSQGSTLSGKVLVDGAPVAGAELTLWGVSLSPHQTQTRYDGRFEIHNLMPGRYRLTLLASRGAVSQDQPVEIDGDREMTIDIPTGILRGRVVGNTGEPIPDATVSIDGTRNGPLGTFSVPAPRSADDGTFETRLAAGTYKVTIQKDGYAPAEATVEVRPGPGGAPVEIRLKPAGP